MANPKQQDELAPLGAPDARRQPPGPALRGQGCSILRFIRNAVEVSKNNCLKIPGLLAPHFRFESRVNGSNEATAVVNQMVQRMAELIKEN
jgi:hypothetical protein